MWKVLYKYNTSLKQSSLECILRISYEYINRRAELRYGGYVDIIHNLVALSLDAPQFPKKIIQKTPLELLDPIIPLPTNWEIEKLLDSAIYDQVEVTYTHTAILNRSRRGELTYASHSTKIYRESSQDYGKSSF